MHAIGTSMPLVDDHADWDLIDARTIGENKTYLKFSRLLNTCDQEQDYPIGVDTNRLIWALGIIFKLEP